jgi:flagellar motor protein MotB
VKAAEPAAIELPVKVAEARPPASVEEQIQPQSPLQPQTQTQLQAQDQPPVQTRPQPQIQPQPQVQAQLQAQAQPQAPAQPQYQPQYRSVAALPVATAQPVTVAPDPQKALLDRLNRSLSEFSGAGNIVMVARKDGIVLEISDTALFASGTAQPAPRAQEIIEKLVAAIGNGKNAVIVEGHTDNLPIRNAQYPSNWELSSARAASVARALQERGVDPDRLTASGMAQTKPRSSNQTEQGRRENRRVSLIILNE